MTCTALVKHPTNRKGFMALAECGAAATTTTAVRLFTEKNASTAGTAPRCHEHKGNRL